MQIYTNNSQTTSSAPLSRNVFSPSHSPLVHPEQLYHLFETSIRLSPTSTLKIAVSACDKVAKHSRIIILTLNTGVEILYYQTSDHSALVC
jgi:hypothetical protein